MNQILSLIIAAIISVQPSSSTQAFATATTDVQTEYKQLIHLAPDINHQALKLALSAYQHALLLGSVKKQLLTVIDYSLPSNKERMWIFDLEHQQLLMHTFVAHGKNSGVVKANHFSNTPESRESSLGTYVTKDTYIGSKGYSLNLQGLEHGINDNALSRRVVVHGAWYVEPGFIHKAGRAGLSWGCPAVAASLAKIVINTIKGGSVVFAYYPDKYFLSHTKFAVA